MAGMHEDVLEQLYAAHYRTLVRLAVLLVKDRETAEEVVQDAFVAVHRRQWSSLRDPHKALAYLRQAVVNGARSALRRRGVEARYAERSANAFAPVVGGADEHAVATEHRAAVLDALRSLPDRQREVLALRYYLELSEAEIARTLGISPGSVKTHTSRGVAALRDRIGEHW
jgi:RNA polymerase sigma-70 factor (sigma-E family)